MLPGLRFVCAAIALAMSLMIFGMGAAALLRSAHEEFASLPGQRPPPATVFSRQPDTPPTLAMLRLEPRAVEPPVAPASPPVPDAPAAVLEPAPAASNNRPSPAMSEKSDNKPAAIAVAEPAPIAAPTTAESEKIAPTAAVALPPVIETPPAPPVPVTVAAITASEPAPAPQPPAVAPAAVSPATVAPAAVARPPEPEQTASVTLPTAMLTEQDIQLSSSRVAVLGGPAV